MLFKFSLFLCLRFRVTNMFLIQSARVSMLTRPNVKQYIFTSISPVNVCQLGQFWVIESMSIKSMPVPMGSTATIQSMLVVSMSVNETSMLIQSPRH